MPASQRLPRSRITRSKISTTCSPRMCGVRSFSRMSRCHPSVEGIEHYRRLLPGAALDCTRQSWVQGKRWLHSLPTQPRMVALETLVKHRGCSVWPAAASAAFNAVAPGVIETDMSHFTKTEAGRGSTLSICRARSRIGQPSGCGGCDFCVPGLRAAQRLDHRAQSIPGRRRVKALGGIDGRY